ncbi:putative Peflin [Hypsibius exemplaris]|uniref:Peflin n=1 Tax=Hypsibius exemplaris TaxID=2072580 RepID=A0A1W0WKM4_HYPEX|nr:putative Peflin [Hypsibius exemplaris]
MSWGQQPQQYGAPPQQPAYPGQASAPPVYPPVVGGNHAYQSHGYNQVPFQAPPQGPPPGIAHDLWQWFQAVDLDRSGQINALELKAALMNANYSSFTEGTCRLMIRMFDRDRTGTININEFSALWKYIGDWKACFERFDHDRSGTINTRELGDALTSFGYRLSPHFNQTLVKSFAARRSTGTSTEDAINFDDFIEACVTVKNLTDTFRRYDTQGTGVVTFGFEQYLDSVLQNIV